MYKISQINPVRCFPIIFLAVFFISLFLWNSATIADEDYWVGKKIQLINDLETHNLNFNLSIHSTHPGTFPLLVSNLFPSNLFSPLRSIRLACVLIDSFATFFILFYVYKIYKNNLWLFVLASLLLGGNYYLFTNPPDIVTAKLVGLAWIIAFFHSIKQKDTPWCDTLILGASIGLAFSSRIHMAMALIFLIPPLIWHYTSFKKMVLFLFATVFIFFLTCPYLWYSPFFFLSTSFAGVNYSINNDIALVGMRAYYYREVSIVELLLATPLATASAISLLSLLTLKRKLFVSRIFLLSLFLVLVASIGLILKSSVNTMRYFYPAIFILHIFLPIFTMEILNTHIMHKLKLYSHLFLYTALCVLSLLLLLSTAGMIFNDTFLIFPPIIVHCGLTILFLLGNKKNRITTNKIL